MARHYGHTPTRAGPLWPSARHRTYGRAGPGRAKVERANGVIGDTLRAFANGRKDDWDRHLPLAVFAINNAASSLGDGLTPFFMRGARALGYGAAGVKGEARRGPGRHGVQGR